MQTLVALIRFMFGFNTTDKCLFYKKTDYQNSEGSGNKKTTAISLTNKQLINI